MAKKKITKEDIAPKDIFSNVTEGARQAKTQIDLLKKSVNALKSSASSIKKSVGGAKMGDTKGLKDFDSLQKKANQTAKAKLNIDKQLLHQKQRLSQIQADENKHIRTTIQATQKLSQVQQKSLGTLQKLELSSRKLRAERSKLNLETKKGSQRLAEINRKLDSNNAKIRASGDAMKKQRTNVGNYAGAMGGLVKTLGMLGGAFAVFRLIKGAFNVIKDFEQSQANLASVLGVNVDAMGELTEQAKELGATTTFTASQVAELQLEFAKLGFTQKQIEGMTEATLLLAEATGSELGETASVVGATMRGFGLDVGETQRVVDVMANSFSKSSLDMSKFATSMSSVAPVAKLAGKSIEETTALIGTLTDRGIDASTAGTGLRNMFLQANKHGLTFNEALDKIEGSVDKTKTAMKLFGSRGATLGVILSENRDQVAELTTKLEMSNGAAKAMADTQRDTLGGALKLLQSAWEGMILSMDEAGGVGEMLKNGIGFLADNLETIVGVIGTAIKVWIAYKVILRITVIQNNLMASSMMRLARSQKGIKGALSGMAAGFKKVGKALSANAIGIAIVAITWALSKLNDMYKSVNRGAIKYAEIQEELAEISEKGTEQIGEEKGELALLIVEIKSHNAGSKERGELLQIMNDKYGTHLKNIDDETQANKDLEEAMQGVIKSMEMKIRLQTKSAKFQKIVLELQKAEEIVAQSSQAAINRYWGATDKVINDLIKRMFAASGVSAKLRKKMNGLSLQEKRRFLLNNNRSQQEKNDIKLVNKLTADKIKFEKELGKAITAKNDAKEDEVFDDSGVTDTGGGGTPEKTVSLIRAIEDARLKLLEEGQEKEELLRAKQFEKLVEDTRKKKTHRKEFDAWLIEQTNLLTKDLNKINDKYLEEKEKAEQESIQARMQLGISEKEAELNKIADIFENYEETEALRREIDADRIAMLRQKAQFEVDNDKLSKEEQEKILLDYWDKVEAIEGAARERTLKHDIEARAVLQKAYAKAEDDKLLVLLRSDASQEEISEQMLAFQIEQLEALILEYKKLYPQLTDEITKMEIDLEQKRRTQRESEIKDTQEAADDMARLRQDGIQAMTDFFIQKADERIAKLDDELVAHRLMADALRQMAIQGNISAKESLAVENQLIAEAEAEKAEIEQRKQRIMMVSAILSAYVANIDAGQDSNTALANAITSKAVLDTFIANIGGFFEGTEDTGTVGNPLDSNGGRIAVLHNNERVLTAKQNKKIGGYSNEQVASIVEQNRLGKLAVDSQIGESWDSHLVVEQLMKVEDKLDAVNKTIENKEVSKVELGAITQASMKIVETRKKGLNRTISTYKVSV